MAVKFLGILILVFSSAAQASNFDSDFYHRRYGLNDPYAKRIDNRGNGYDALYGLRNMREVINGVLYRGGGNNVYNKHGKRSNVNPLPTEGIQHLCEEGFSTGIYLYSDRYATAPHQENCSSIRGSNHLDYLQISPFSKPYDILKLVYAAIFNPARGPIYVHCWNGWHASGMISALALRQFCGVSGVAAVNYWVKDTDGNPNGAAASIKKTIMSFKPFPDLKISPSVQQNICPKI